MSRNAFGILMLALLTCSGAPLVAATATQGTTAGSSHLAERLRRSLEAGRSPGELAIGSETVYASEALARFYEERGFEPAWVDSDRARPRARVLTSLLQEAEIHGLRGGDYHLGLLTDLLGGRGGPAVEDVDDLELTLSDAALVYAAHLAAGKTDPTRLHSHWRANREGFDAAAFLAQALARGDLRAAYDRLLPAHLEYGRLQLGLAALRDVDAAGGWGGVPPGDTLRPAETSDRVPALRARLTASGDLPRTSSGAGNDPTYDSDLEAAVRVFQGRHGLSVDGIVGERTRGALNVPVKRRIEQARVNLERWRWLPAELGDRHLRVNIAGFELQAVEGGSVPLAFRVIVGKAYTKTPVFSDEVTYLVANPFWYVPRSIAGREMLPKIQADPPYLEREALEVLDGTGPSARVLDPATIDWHALSAATLPYVFRQRPGDANSLGRIKFMFPNSYNVYLHDTPERRLFERDLRTLSHGCIRLERPLDLAAWVLRDDPRWSRELLQAVIDSGIQKTIVLPEPFPIHILYWTAWADGSGALHFRDDVYDRDAAVLRALDEAPPGRGPARENGPP